jgi:hypothetical protein
MLLLKAAEAKTRQPRRPMTGPGLCGPRLQKLRRTG